MNAREIFRPVWVRGVAVGLAAGWAALELWRGEVFWLVVALFTTALAYWEFFGAGDAR